MLLAAPLAVLGVPGSFGRYVEHYRQRGHLRTFLRRTTIWTVVCSVTALVTVLSFAPQFSRLIFGTADKVDLVLGIAVCLVVIILHHMITSLFTALRMYRVVSAINFGQSLLFAAVSLSLLWWIPCVCSLLIGYGVACLVTSLAALIWALPGFREITEHEDRLSHNEFWSKLLRFAFFIWISNILVNLFGIVDRYMIVHFGNFSPEEALQQVGYFHSSRLVPMLMIAFADMLCGLVMPHLSHDWEAGRRDEVSRRMNFTLKLTALGMTAFGAAVLLFSPLLFGVVLQGKYDDGLAVLPWTLVGAIWCSSYIVAQNYLWCAEKTKIAVVPVAIGLLMNVVLNLALLPVLGLLGAVLATALSTAVCLTATLVIDQLSGMQIARGTWIIALSGVSIGFGAVPASLVLLLLVFVSLTTNLLFDHREREDLRKLVVRYLSKLLPLISRRQSVPTGQ